MFNTTNSTRPDSSGARIDIPCMSTSWIPQVSLLKINSAPNTTTRPLIPSTNSTNYQPLLPKYQTSLRPLHIRRNFAFNPTTTTWNPTSANHSTPNPTPSILLPNPHPKKQKRDPLSPRTHSAQMYTLKIACMLGTHHTQL